MNGQSDTTATQVAKVVSAWAFIGITSWAEAASFVAFLYSCWLLGEKIWKSVLRPMAERRGWIAKAAGHDA